MKRTTWETKEFILPAERKYGIRFFIKFCYALLLRIVYRLLYLFVRAPQGTKYKYELSICAIFKNEACYLKEWIEFHKLIGVQHFYLYNNNSDDDFGEVLKPYIDDGCVTLVNFPGKQMQMKAYSDCLSKRREESHWIALIDIDEFIVTRYEDDLKEFLRSFKNRPIVKLNWNVFGTSGRMERDLDSLVIEDFTQCWKKMDMVGKILINSDFEFDTDYKRNRSSFHHLAWGGVKGFFLPPVNCLDHICLYDFEWFGTDEIPVMINHYFTKSVQEYIAKANKGDVFFEVTPKNWQYMWNHERYCLKTDYSAYKYLSLLKLKMADNSFDITKENT